LIDIEQEPGAPRLVTKPVVNELGQGELAVAEKLRRLVELRPVRDRAGLGLGRLEGARQLMQRLVTRPEVDDLPHRLPGETALPSQRGQKSGKDDRRLAAARAADYGYDIGRGALPDLLDQLLDEALAAEEEADVLLAEWQKPAIGRKP
jgi:hypothetical protein